MGYQKHKRPTLHMSDAKFSTSPVASTDAGIAQTVQTISLSGASGVYATANISSRGVTFVTSTGTGALWTVNLDPPGRPGIEKKVQLYMSGASTVPITVRTASSSQVFFGSTRNGLSMSTAAGSSQPFTFTLISKTSKQWAIHSLTNVSSTYIPSFTSTGSTA